MYKTPRAIITGSDFGALRPEWQTDFAVQHQFVAVITPIRRNSFGPTKHQTPVFSPSMPIFFKKTCQFNRGSDCAAQVNG
jgi:hypothetical protein